MKSKKELKKIYDQAKGVKEYYSFEDFCLDARIFKKTILKRQFIMSMKVSSSGMTRKFNTIRLNMFLNICYDQKATRDKVKVRGCGMDMAWHLLYSVCQKIMTSKEISNKERSINLLCSDYIII